jgi:hypothetical protein
MRPGPRTFFFLLIRNKLNSRFTAFGVGPPHERDTTLRNAIARPRLAKTSLTLEMLGKMQGGAPLFRRPRLATRSNGILASQASHPTPPHPRCRSRRSTAPRQGSHRLPSASGAGRRRRIGASRRDRIWDRAGARNSRICVWADRFQPANAARSSSISRSRRPAAIRRIALAGQ